MAENGPIEDLAKIISSKLFERFKWSQYGPCDQDFPCINEDNHKPEGKQQDHTHPVDVVFHYKDPYLNKTIYLNTDLKSYSKGSLNRTMIEKALSSLAETVYCAEFSESWKEKYHTCVGKSEIRGLLFVYNHDNDYKHDFYDYFYPPKPITGNRSAAVNLDNINLSENQQIHIIEPKVINYLMSITADMNELIYEKKFPQNEYGFYYPQLTYHKVIVSEEYLPATVETLTAPFMVIKHGPVIEYNRELGIDEHKYPPGYVIYYNKPGDTDMEFYYLLDTLTNYQILNGRNRIRIRVAAKDKNEAIRSNFIRALEKYSFDWGYDEEARKNLFSIELHLVPIVKEFYSKQSISWEIK
ncbi:hypothetical protein [Yersinia enterocolitica]|uniref:hypothetical protein n=1 Tax=Yersinia enterocolitica TaxID=630 RepID=UPI001C60F783|nr:hypothetical protein [Yersinia enterocolitica]MBW5837300.1 hypothetical protein [Yersinia enterocolitica]MBW5861161.1 hypothetical protein [Yersinia enterocolitica]MBW5872068.1 hypothetical protein [Yersinia enterocolitica]